MEPCVAVIVPTYNRPALLIRALKSIEAQTKKADQIIVVNDYPGGSLPLGFENITFMETDGQLGPSYARRLAMLGLKSHINSICYLDDDDELLPNHIELLSNEIKKGVQFAFSKALYKYENGFQTEDPEPNNRSLNKRYYDSSALLDQNIAPISSFMLTVKAYHAIGGWDPSVFRMEDWDFWGRLFIQYGQPTFINEVTNIIYKGQDNRTDSNPYVYSMGCSWRDIVSDRLKAMYQVRKGDFREVSNLPRIPRVGIVMPVYNCEKYIRESISSILDQDFQDWELLFINDGSTDQSLQIALNFGDKRIRIFRGNGEPNVGVTKALNYGLLMSRSEYIARMDADDLCVPKRLSKQVNFLDKNRKVSILGTCFTSMNENMSSIVWENDVEKTDEEIKKTLPIRCCIGHPTVMMRRKVIETIGGYSEEERHKAVEDYELWLRAKSKGFSFATLPDFLLKHRVHESQVSSKLNQLQKDNTERLIKEYINDR